MPGTAASIAVWRIALDVPVPAADDLSEAERAQAARFHFARDRERYIVAHVALRRILAPQVGVAPAALAFDIGLHGKPSLAGGSGLHFNLSHSGDLAVLAVSRHGPLGVDVEAVRASADLVAVAEANFSPSEVRQVLALSGEAQVLAFFHTWTRKEAYIKAIGIGLSHPLEAFSVTAFPADARLLEIEGDERAAHSWVMRALTLPRGYVGAVAMRAKAAEVSEHDWSWSAVTT